MGIEFYAFIIFYKIFQWKMKGKKEKKTRNKKNNFTKKYFKKINKNKIFLGFL